jgi:hypothetical protein
MFIFTESASSGLVTSNSYNHPGEHKAQGKLTVRDLVTVFLLTELVTHESRFLL